METIGMEAHQVEHIEKATNTCIQVTFYVVFCVT